jgi:hypothetical protein
MSFTLRHHLKFFLAITEVRITCGCDEQTFSNFNTLEGIYMSLLGHPADSPHGCERTVLKRFQT